MQSKFVGWVLATLICGNLVARDLPESERPANAASEQVINEATRILNSLKATEYKHKTDIDEEKGAYYCDCSGFVGYVLNRTVAKDDGKGPFGDGKLRPLAMDYAKGFAAAPVKAEDGARWVQIERLVDARPGDVIAWRHEVPKPGNTGHVVVVAEAPTVEDDGLVRVVSIDSTSKPQAEDTRAKGTNGIGRCTMWFKVDSDGRPIAHIRGARKSAPKSEAISIGRPLPTKQKGVAKKAA